MNRRRAYTLVELLVAIAIIGILLALLLSAVQAARGAARRVACANNLRQTVLAATVLVDARRALPAGTLLAGTPQPWRGWLVTLLPYLERGAVAAAVDAEYRASPDPFDVVAHPWFTKPMPEFSCPDDGRCLDAPFAPNWGVNAGLTSYMGCLGSDSALRDGVLFGNSAIRLADVTDGTSRTLLCGERPPSPQFDWGWWYAGVGNGAGELDHTVGTLSHDSNKYGDCGPGPYPFQPGDLRDECSTNHFWSTHPGGGHFARVDGSVRFHTYDGAAVLVPLSTRAGAESAADD